MDFLNDLRDNSNINIEFLAPLVYLLEGRGLDEEDVEAILTLPGRPTSSVHEVITIEAVALDNYIDVVYVEATGCYVRANQNVVGARLSESVESELPLVLGEVAVNWQEVRVLFVAEIDGLFLCLSEYHYLLAPISNDEVLYAGHFVLDAM